MPHTLEWFQCTSCGRRHRWQADCAGETVECPCGTEVFCPELDVFADPGGSDTMPDPASSDVRIPAGESDPDHFPGEMIGIEGAKAYRIQRRRRDAMSGSHPFGEAVFWTLGAAVGFALFVHAIITLYWWYILLTALWTPISFVRCWKKLKRWRGDRSLLQALEEEFGD